MPLESALVGAGILRHRLGLEGLGAVHGQKKPFAGDEPVATGPSRAARCGHGAETRPVPVRCNREAPRMLAAVEGRLPAAASAPSVTVYSTRKKP